VENVAPHILHVSKIHVVSSRYTSYTFLTYNTCESCTISMRISYENNIISISI
jgi:hypothetical protein